MYTVQLLNEKLGINEEILCTAGDFILDSAEKQGIKLPYSCRQGKCGTCVGRLVTGVPYQLDALFLDDDRIANGFFLLCVGYVKNNSKILVCQEDTMYDLDDAEIDNN